MEMVDCVVVVMWGFVEVVCEAAVVARTSIESEWSALSFPID